MSQDVETIRQFFEAMSRLDPDAACSLASEGYESSIARSVSLGLVQRRVRGRDGLRGRIEELAEGWPIYEIDFTVEPRGAVFLVRGRYAAYQDRHGGHDAPFVSVVRLDDEGKVSTILSCGSEREAGRALAL